MTEIIDIFLTFVVREHYCKLLLFDVGFYLLTFFEEAYDMVQTDEVFFYCSALGQNVTFEQVITHLEQSCRHLESLADPLIYELTEHDEVCCCSNIQF